MTRFNLQPGFVWGYSMIIPTNYPFVGLSHGYSIVVNHIYIILYITQGFLAKTGLLPSDVASIGRESDTRPPSMAGGPSLSSTP